MSVAPIHVLATIKRWAAAYGFGDAATRDVGTTAGTVAAGDDPRFGEEAGAVVVTRRTVAAPYTVLADDHELWVTSAGDVTIPATQNSDGRRLVVQHRVLAGGIVRLVPATGLINADASHSLLLPYETVGMTGDGTNWGRAF